MNILAEAAEKVSLRRKKRPGTRAKTPFAYQESLSKLRGKVSKTPRPNTFFWTKNEDNALINFLKRHDIFTPEGGVRWRLVPENSILRRRMVGGTAGKQLRKRWERLMVLYPNKVPIK